MHYQTPGDDLVALLDAPLTPGEDNKLLDYLFRHVADPA